MPDASVPPRPEHRTALCLCGGGVTGGMYELGALSALDDFLGAKGGTRFTVNDFDIYVGTSVGSFVATLLCGGSRPRDLFRAVMAGDRKLFPLQRTDIYRFDRRQGLDLVQSILSVLYDALRNGARGRLYFDELISSLTRVLPAGVFSLAHYEKFLSQYFSAIGLPMRFSEARHELYITANDLDSGHRVVFGQPGHTDIPVPKAICASSAIPIFFEPVRWRGHDFVDGAVGKVEHADVALHRGADLVVVVNPLVPVRNDPDRESGGIFGAPTHLRDRGLISVWNQANRMSTTTKLAQGLNRYRAQYPKVSFLLIQPQEEENELFMENPMNFDSRRRMLRHGYESAARVLRTETAAFTAGFARHEIAVDVGGLLPAWDLS